MLRKSFVTRKALRDSGISVFLLLEDSCEIQKNTMWHAHMRTIIAVLPTFHVQSTTAFCHRCCCLLKATGLWRWGWLCDDGPVASGRTSDNRRVCLSLSWTTAKGAVCKWACNAVFFCISQEFAVMSENQALNVMPAVFERVNKTCYNNCLHKL